MVKRVATSLYNVSFNCKELSGPGYKKYPVAVKRVDRTWFMKYIIVMRRLCVLIIGLSVVYKCDYGSAKTIWVI